MNLKVTVPCWHVVFERTNLKSFDLFDRDVDRRAVPVFAELANAGIAARSAMHPASSGDGEKPAGAERHEPSRVVSSTVECVESMVPQPR